MVFFRKKKIVYTSGSLTREAWKKFFGNKLSLAALSFILLMIIVALSGYLITPDATPMANRQVLEIAAKKPGFSVLMLQVPREVKSAKRSVIHRMLFGQRSDFSYIPVHSYTYEDGVLSVREYMGDDDLPGETLQFQMSRDQADRMLSRKHYLLGTDQFGRDFLSRLMIGSRVSLAVGFISVLISLLIGITLGTLGGFYKGWVDKLVIWLINVIWSIPTLLLVIAITFALGKGFWQIFVAVGFTMWIEVARVTRGQVLSLREKEYVEAARALGFSNLRIIFRHILPNALGPIIVISAANFASAILIEAGLSFLGIGVQPPMPSWGGMIRENYAYLILDASHLAILPGIAIMLTVLSFMIIGNGLRDALDVRTQEAQQI